MAGDFIGLQQPIGEGGIRTVNFFNGRLLKGSDLGREQAARREADARIGQAMGDGVAYGLDVSFAGKIAPGNRPAARVRAGLAVNREGRTLRLAHDVLLALGREAAVGATVACLFDDCPGLSEGAYVVGQGLFLLTIAPAYAQEGRAQASGLDQANVRCNIDATVEGVQFRLIEIAPSHFRETTFGAANFRNHIAYRAFGTGVTATWPENLLGVAPRDVDLIAELRPHGLGDAEVPLALLAFTGSFDHLFTDNWCVRRRVAPPDARSVFANLSAPRRASVGEAMFRQFQTHIDELAGTGRVIAPATARGQFRYLPPAGILPWITDRAVADFFAGMTVRGPVHINAPSVEPLLRESLVAPAISSDSAEAVWLYRVAETAMAQPSAAPVLIFASGHLPYRADARFDLFHWDYANYALIP
jgi:hypothetical protein